MVSQENDQAFEAVLQNTGQNIELFVDEFFSFLARRSDFFVVTPPEGGKIGFPPGVAAKLIISKFKKWEEYQKGMKNLPPPVEIEDIPGVGHVMELPKDDPDKSIKPVKPKESQKTESVKPGKPSNSSKPIGLCDTYNGRKTDKYSWSQSIKELDIHLAVGADVKTKKQVKVEIHMNKIRVVTLTGTNPGDETVTDWQLAHPIVKDESYWSLHPGESIFLSLQKVREMWWDHLFEGEECIDKTKIEAVRPMEDLGDEEQAKIQELVFNQEQKLKGLQTSEEMKMEEVMKKAWNAEGSPFKGQPFDMSRIQLATNTITNMPNDNNDQPPS